MHPVYRTILASCLALISLMIACGKCRQQQLARQEQYQLTKKGWTPELEQAIYDIFYKQAPDFGGDENAQKAFANCCLRRVKELFPDGLSNAEQLASDTMKAKAIAAGADCARPFIKKTNIWSPSAVEQLKLQLYSSKETQLLKDKAIKKEYVDCIAFKLMAQYPTGLSDTVNKTALKKFVMKEQTDCLKLLANKYEQLKKLKADTLRK